MSGCGQRHQSLCECAVRIRWSSSVAFEERHRGRVPLFIDVRPWAGHRGMTVGINESRFATSRVWDLWERVRCLINDFLKIVDKTPDDRRWARGKPGVD